MTHAARADFAHHFDKAEAGNTRGLGIWVQRARIKGTPARPPDVSEDGFAFICGYTAARENGKLAALVTSLCEAELLKADETILDLVAPEAQVKLQAITDRDSPFLETQIVARAMLLACKRVCRIINDDTTGTGFLVGPETVLTNWHVVKTCFAADGTPQPDNIRELIAEFDVFNRTAGDGGLAGTQVRITAITLISPAYGFEYKQTPIPGNAWEDEEECLDFALLTLERAIGYERDWYRLPTALPAQGCDIVVCHHPKAFALKTTFGKHKEFSGPKNRRVFHSANTLDGSSGGLCLGYDALTRALSPVAMHQGNVKRTETAEINVAIPLAKLPEAARKAAASASDRPPVLRLNEACGYDDEKAPVFGRREFQKHVQKLIAGDGQILVVRPGHAQPGQPPVDGKSFSEKILRSMLDVSSHFIVSVKASDLKSDAREQAEFLLSRLERAGSAPPALHDQTTHGAAEGAYIRDYLWPAFRERARQAAGVRTLWLVIDDLEKIDLLDTGGRHFLAQLYSDIASLPCLRVVLLGYRGAAETLGNDRVLYDRLDRHPGTEDIKSWVKTQIAAELQDPERFTETLANVVLSFATGDARSSSARDLARVVRAHFDPTIPTS